MYFVFAIAGMITVGSNKLIAQSSSSESASTQPTGKSLFIDVHNLEPGKVTFADVVAAHKKDLATEGKYDVSFIEFWVDEQKGKVYCLSS